MIKYLGSKRTLLPILLDVVSGVSECRTVLDMFSGTSRVGHALKRAGYRVFANDHNAYAAALARCYVAADVDRLGHEAALLIDELDALPGRAGWFTHTYCERSRFFQPHMASGSMRFGMRSRFGSSSQTWKPSCSSR